MWLFLYQPFPIVPRFYCIFLGVSRDIRGDSDLSQIASTVSGGTNISRALGCGEVPESWLLLLLNDRIFYCSAVSFSFCSVHIINNSTNVEYFKRWPLLLSSIPMNYTACYWDKPALSVHFYAWYTPWVLFFPCFFLSSRFLFLKY